MNAFRASLQLIISININIVTSHTVASTKIQQHSYINTTRSKSKTKEQSPLIVKNQSVGVKQNQHLNAWEKNPNNISVNCFKLTIEKDSLIIHRFYPVRHMCQNFGRKCKDFCSRHVRNMSVACQNGRIWLVGSVTNLMYNVSSIFSNADIMRATSTEILSRCGISHWERRRY